MSRVLAVGVVTPLGGELAGVRAALLSGASGLSEQAHLHALPDSRAGVVAGPDLTGFLTRKKDTRLLARAARLALPAAGRALQTLPDEAREHTAVYVAVGREPPDDPDAEPSLVAMSTLGRLDPAAVGGRGRELYPPLLPLRTLPNMVLAHVCIQYNLRGENGTFAGGAQAGAQALRAARLAVDEGRAPFAVGGAAFSAVDLGSARDRLRLGASTPPGEAAVFVLFGPGEATAMPEGSALEIAALAETAFGDCGPVNGCWAIALGWSG